MTPVLRARDLIRRFGATCALDHVSLDLAAGRVRVLLGMNGAGKSTFLHVVGGHVHCDAGDLDLDGRPYRPASPAEARRRGVQIIAQEPTVVAELSVVENVMLGAEHARCGFVSRAAERAACRAALARLSYGDLDVDLLGGELSLPLRHVVAIARALVQAARVVVFDEPTSALTREESDRVVAVVRELAAQGTAVLYVTHFLDEAARVCDDWTVMRDGRVVASGDCDHADVETWIEHMSGHAALAPTPRLRHEAGDVVLALTNLSGPVSPRGVDLFLRRGEIFGLYGLAGSGRTALLLTAFGALERTSGEVRVQGRRLGPGPRAGVAAGLALLTEERRLDGTLPGASVQDNVSLSRLDAHARAGFLRRPALIAAVRRSLARVRAQDVEPGRTIDELSGGMQQRVALARLVHAEPEIYLLDEPTRGIDVATQGEIHRAIGELVRDGRSVLVSSSSTDELLALCDTIGVLRRGRLVEVRATREWTRSELLAAASREESTA